MKKKDPNEKGCYYCKERKPISEMEEMGVWVCKECLVPAAKRIVAKKVKKK